jgi:hypothetical protein
MRCFQCLRFGHLASRCAAEKRVAAGSCFRCGKEGHLARDCENDPWCHNCGVAGHRGDRVAYPEYRKAMEATRESRRPRKAVA